MLDVVVCARTTIALTVVHCHLKKMLRERLRPLYCPFWIHFPILLVVLCSEWNLVVFCCCFLSKFYFIFVQYGVMLDAHKREWERMRSYVCNGKEMETKSFAHPPHKLKSNVNEHILQVPAHTGLLMHDVYMVYGNDASIFVSYYCCDRQLSRTQYQNWQYKCDSTQLQINGWLFVHNDVSVMWIDKYELALLLIRIKLYKCNNNQIFNRIRNSSEINDLDAKQT